MKITQIKIYGERLSGTNYLQRLLQNNFDDVSILGFLHTDPGGWKHSPEKVSTLNAQTTLCVVVFREVEAWLRAFQREPHHIQARPDLNAFVQQPMLPRQGRGSEENHLLDASLNYHLTPLQMRQKKTHLWRAWGDGSKNVVFVHLAPLQKFGAHAFLQMLRDVYGLKGKKPTFEDIGRHVKSGRQTKETPQKPVKFDPTSRALITKHLQTDEEFFVQQLGKQCLAFRRDEPAPTIFCWPPE